MTKNMLTFVILVCVEVALSETTYEILAKEKLLKLITSHKNRSDVESTVNAEFGKNPFATIPSDNGGNYGDLLHDYRQNGDVLIIRETMINDLTSSEELDMYWYGNFPARISHVRALNFGRERGYAYQIVTRKNNGYAEVYVRIPPHNAIRMFIEVYGFP